MDDNEQEERRLAELEFVSAAYTEEEAWYHIPSEESNSHDDCGSLPVVYRRLICSGQKSEGNDDDDEVAVFLLELGMTLQYPLQSALQVHGKIEEERTCGRLLKAAYNALPGLIQACRDTADSLVGEEAVFAVLSRAEEWMQGEWSEYSTEAKVLPFKAGQDLTSSTSQRSPSAASTTIILGRRLVYSHHIISTRKRSDMKDLASHHGLTGYVKIGWPGIILLEGRDEDCNSFYDTIRRWAWQYLVVRGEMQEEIKERDLDAKRCFDSFLEVDDMSVVASHCREVGLEALFRTSMKVYGGGGGGATDDNGDETTNHLESLRWHGALVHVDHMNDGKSYRKWLRRTSQEMDISLLIRQVYPNNDFSKRPRIIVGVFGSGGDDQGNSVSGFLKRWRTSRVDVDSRGKPCLERMMRVLVQGEIEASDSAIGNGSGIVWDALQAEDQLHATRDQLETLVGTLCGPAWVDALATVWEIF